jgi:hypothetical protein
MDKKKPEAQARAVKAQFARTRHGAGNNGVASADPQVISGKENGDATFPIEKDDVPKGKHAKRD